jgi:predicted O-methyltransferase YrrM
MYRFDHDWFSVNVPNIKNLSLGNEEAEIKILEIGAFEGRSTVFLADHFKKATITTIDTWDGSPEHEDNPEINFKSAKENFDYNIGFHKDRIKPIQGKSFDVLMDLYKSGETFNFVYIDGAHDAVSVNSDLILSFSMMTVGGLLYCDDYYWGFNEKHYNNHKKTSTNFVFDSPKLGIDSFVNVYANKLRPVLGLTNTSSCFVKVAE